MAHDMYPHDRPTLSPALMLRAYAAGIFPMSEGADDPHVFWVDPQRRGVFPLDGFHISRSLARRMRSGRYTVAVDSDFAGVVAGCAAREPTWINAEITACYLALHAQGLAHSVEIREGDTLAGGVFGITIGGAFFGESMFSARPDASKVALACLILRLRAGGFSLFDTQFLTEHLQSLGAREIRRADYREKLARALTQNANFLELPLDTPVQAALQLSTQTS